MVPFLPFENVVIWKKRTNITNPDATKNNTIRNYYTNVLLLKKIFTHQNDLLFLFNEKEINFQQALSAFIPFQKCKNIIVNITNFQIVKSKNKKFTKYYCQVHLFPPTNITWNWLILKTGPQKNPPPFFLSPGKPPIIFPRVLTNCFSTIYQSILLLLLLNMTTTMQFFGFFFK